LRPGVRQIKTVQPGKSAQAAKILFILCILSKMPEQLLEIR
jgi:hypothetical protein